MAVNDKWKPNTELVEAIREIRLTKGNFDYQAKLEAEAKVFNTVYPPERLDFDKWRQNIHNEWVKLEDLSRLNGVQTNALSAEQREVISIFKSPQTPLEQKKVIFQMALAGFLQKRLVKIGNFNW